MSHDPSKAKSSYAKIHEPKTLFTRDSYYQYLEGQLNKMALFMVQSTKDGERIARIEELIERYEDKLLKMENSMKSLAIYSHEIASHEMLGNLNEDRIDNLERKLRRMEEHMLNSNTKGTSTNRRQQESQQSCQTDARYEHIERQLSKLKKSMMEGSHHRSNSKISAQSSRGGMKRHRNLQSENPVFGGSHLQSQKTEKLVDRHLDDQHTQFVQKRQMEDIAFSTCTQIIRDELKDVVLRPQLKQLETKMKEYFTTKFESISQIIGRVEFARDGEYHRSGNLNRLTGKKDTTKIGDTTQSSLKRRTQDRTANDQMRHHKREKTVDPFPSIDESEPQRLSFTLKGGLFNTGQSFEEQTKAAKVQFSERNMKKKKSLKVTDSKELSKRLKNHVGKDKSKSKSRKSHSKSHSRSVSRSASRSISKSVSRSALKSIDSHKSKSRSRKNNDRTSSVSSVSRKHSQSRSLSKSHSQTKQQKPKSNRIPEDMTNRHRYPSHIPPKKKLQPSKKLSIHSRKQIQAKKKS